MVENIIEILRKMKPLRELYGIDDMIYPYHHTTFKVETLCEFMDIISGFGKALKNEKTDKIYYRGMGDKEWKPIPSLARNIEFQIKEKELIHKFQYRCPDDFLNIKTNFELLANMQHYGLPTRLLDFTENPLVALYFACKDIKKSDGRVLCLCDSENPFMDTCAKISCDIACNCDDTEQIDLYTQKYNFTSFDFIDIIYREHPYALIKPPYWYERQKRQCSVFLVFSSLLLDSYGQAIHYGYDFDIEKCVRLSIEKIENLIKIYQCSKWKPDEYFKKSYPLKESLSFVMNKESWELLKDCYRPSNIQVMETNCTNRFRILPQLDTINKDELEDFFCSIIIPAKCKKNILYELTFVGMDESFVYPEKEYIAYDIKNNI